MPDGDVNRARAVCVQAGNEDISRSRAVVTTLLPPGDEARFVSQAEDKILDRPVSPCDTVSVATNEVVPRAVQRSRTPRARR